MIIAISFALALFLSFVLVPLASRYANALGLMDAPDERKVHSQAIPRAGGIAIVIAFFVPALFWLSDIASLLGFFSGAAIIAVFGFLDDRHNLNYKWKFLGQILGVAIFLASNIEITKTPFLGLGDLLPWVSYPVMAIFILGVINAVNLSDGLDGLAAGSSLLSLGFIALLGYGAAEYTIAIIAVSAMGALTGFLRFNTHPATIFMGDTGSQFLGYVAGCLAIMLTQAPSLAVSPVLAILIVGLPILDTFLVMVLRLYAGESPFKPDKQHLHHQLLSKGLMHYQAVGAIYLLSFSLLVCALYRSKGKTTQMASIEKRSIDPIELIGMDHQGPHYEIGRTFDRLFAWASTTDGIITPETKGIAVFFDDPRQKPPEELTSLAAIPRPDGKEPGEGTRSYTIPGGPHAIARHVGPYTELARTYTELFQNWLPASGEARNGAPLFEINMNDPKTTPPSDLITDIYVPLK